MRRRNRGLEVSCDFCGNSEEDCLWLLLRRSKWICGSCVFRGLRTADAEQCPAPTSTNATSGKQRCLGCGTDQPSNKLFYQVSGGCSDDAAGICPKCLECCVTLFEQQLALLTAATNEVLALCDESEAPICCGSLRDWATAESELGIAFASIDAWISGWLARFFTTPLLEAESKPKSSDEAPGMCWVRSVGTEYPADIAQFPVSERLALMVFILVQFYGSRAIRLEYSNKHEYIFLKMDGKWVRILSSLSKLEAHRLVSEVSNTIAEQLGFRVLRPRGRAQRFWDEQNKWLLETGREHFAGSLGDTTSSSKRSLQESLERSYPASLRQMRIQANCVIRTGDESHALQITQEERPEYNSERWFVKEIQIIEWDQMARFAGVDDNLDDS